MFAKTREVFKQVQNGKTSLILEQTVFTEIIFVLSSFYKAPKNEIYKVLSELLAYKGIICEDKESLLAALELYNKEALHIVDCVLIARSKALKTPILSFDQKLLDVTS